jgi:ABC-type Fe3+-hydroxamate transport system substrate-binding protein
MANTMTDLIPNLAELAQFLERESDAAQLAAAFSTDSLEDARATLRKTAKDWETSEDRVTRAGEARS